MSTEGADGFQNAASHFIANNLNTISKFNIFSGLVAVYGLWLAYYHWSETQGIILAVYEPIKTGVNSFGRAIAVLDPAKLIQYMVFLVIFKATPGTLDIISKGIERVNKMT